MAREYDPTPEDVVEFKISKARFGKDRGFKATCKDDGWSVLEETEQAAARRFGEHMRDKHYGKRMKKV